MAKLERIYRRTASGLKALQSEDPALPEEHRRILDLIGEEMHSDTIRSLLRRHADHARLAELEAKGLVACENAAAEHNLDFTGSFAFSSAAR
jgi:hypothetical protein